MKKIFVIFLACLFLVGCETQEERNEREKNENIDKISEEYKDYQVSDNVKNWIINTKIEKVVTILCLNSSKKCKEINDYYTDIANEYEIKIEYVELDNISDEDKNAYKTLYDIKDYASYVPYIFIVNKGVLVSTKKDIYKKEEIIDFFKENNLITFQ